MKIIEEFDPIQKHITKVTHYMVQSIMQAIYV